MDRSWMYAKRDFEYLKRLNEFITQAVEHQRRHGDDEQLICPCSACKNRKKVNSGSEMRDHLILKGFKPNYTVWIWHGEKENDIPNCPNAVNVQKQVDNIMVDFEVTGEGCNNNEVNEQSDDKDCHIEGDNVDQMMDDLEKDFVDCPEIFQMLVSDSKKPLFPGCSKFTRLSAVLKLYTLKAGNGWSDKSFTALLKLLSDMLPKGNELPTNTYRCKKVLCPLATNYQKIHACPSDCILYRKDYSDLDECPRCKKSRYKLKEGRKKGGPAKTLWYLSIIPWFKRLFANPKDAEYMLWHDKGRKKDGKLRHVADAGDSANKVQKQAMVKGNTEASCVEEEDHVRPLSVEEVEELGYFGRSLEEKLCSLSKNATIEMVIDESVYNYQEGSARSFLTVIEIREMLRNKWLNVVMLQIWGSFLYQSVTESKEGEPTKVVGYMCPVKLCEYIHRGRQCEDYIAHVWKSQEKKNYIIGAFHESNHWMLIVTCLGLNTIYILDSDRKNPKRLEIKKRLHNAWFIHCAHGGRRNFNRKNNKLIIKDDILCPQQPKDYECGYYVMKWMYNITFYLSRIKEEEFVKHMEQSTMSSADIYEIKEEWATKFLDNF